MKWLLAVLLVTVSTPGLEKGAAMMCPGAALAVVHATAFKLSQERKTPDGEWCQRPESQMPRGAHARASATSRIVRTRSRRTNPRTPIRCASTTAIRNPVNANTWTASDRDDYGEDWNGEQDGNVSELWVLQTLWPRRASGLPDLSRASESVVAGTVSDLDWDGRVRANRDDWYRSWQHDRQHGYLECQ